MALKTGYIKLYRSITNWEWYDDLITKAVFLHLLITVSIEDSEWHGITIKRGSRIASYETLASELGLSFKQIRTAINHLEQTGEVARSKHPKFTVFTVLNYDNFQDGASKGQAKNSDFCSKKAISKKSQEKRASKRARSEHGESPVDTQNFNENNNQGASKSASKGQGKGKVRASKGQQYKKVKEDNKNIPVSKDTGIEKKSSAPFVNGHKDF